MSQHQPGWANQPQQPQQPQWNAQTQPMWGAPPPQPPKKRSTGKVVGLGCLGMIGLFIIMGIVAGAVSSSGSKNDSSGGTASASHNTSKSAAPAKAGGSDNGSGSGTNDGGASHTVTFKVWGTAPAGDLGGLDITYGSDTDNLKGTFKDGTFTGTVPFKKDAMYYDVTAQLQGSGDIQCSVTVDGHTKSGHASGGYNICSAQLSSGLFGGWS